MASEPLRHASSKLAPALALVLVLGACAGRAVPDVRFVNAPIAWEVDDRRDVPTKPMKRNYYSEPYHLQHGLVHHVSDPLRLEAPARAQNVNALGEVPDSTWFTNRIGVRDVGLAEIRDGPDADADPEPHRPWTITGGKTVGALPGFRIVDARGVGYLLKFALPGELERETAADVIVQRLFWAAGYHVPADTVVHLWPADLRVQPGATTVDLLGREHALTPADVRRILALVPRTPDGRLRAVASRLLPGEPIGGYADRGVRPDDPNDVVPHEERRDLRGQYVFFAWVAHTDVKGDNWLDMWTEDPADRGRHYVTHHILDFGKSLGVMAAASHELEDSYAFNVDLRRDTLSAITLGILTRPGERAVDPELPGVGRFEAKQFHPRRYRPRRRFRPFDRLDRFDAFWATKILMRFTPAHIRTAVEAGKLTDRRAEDYLVRTLIARQRRTGVYWFSRVNPLDEPTVSEPSPGTLRLCAVDLLLRYGLADLAEATHYTAVPYGDDGGRVGKRRALRARRDGRLCFGDLPVGPGPQGYTIVKLVTTRSTGAEAPVWVHVARDPFGGEPRVIGIWRE